MRVKPPHRAHSPRLPSVTAVCVGLHAVFWAVPSDAVFLRVGPFDFGLSANVNAIYTTNVDGTRPSQATLAQKDLYFTYGFGVRGSAPMGEETTMSLSTGLDWEKHIERTDLDTESDPLGNARLSLARGADPVRYSVFSSYDRSLETRESAFVAGARPQRDDNTIVTYGGNVSYARGRFRGSTAYSSTRERHKLEEFKDGEEDSEDVAFSLGFAVYPRVRLVYDFSRARSDLLQETDDYTGWVDTQAAGVDIDLWKRPVITYGFRYEKEGQEGDPGEWEPTHTISIGSAEPIYLSETVTLTLKAGYSYEKNPESDDIGFSYGAVLRQQIDALTQHSLSANREPADTFGSKTKTTVTDWAYQLGRSHFLLPDITLAIGLTYSINEPEAAARTPDEKILGYTFGLAHSRPMTPNLNRTLGYAYTMEDSSEQSELLEEHRVVLTLTYTL